RRNQDQELSRRDGASHLSLLVQRNLAQRKHTPPSRPMLRIGFAEPAGFSERASCPRGKRRASMHGALRVLSAGSAATERPRRPRTKPTALHVALPGYAVGRGYAPDALFAATCRAGLDPLPFRIRRDQDQELSRRDGASHLSWRKESTPRIHARRPAGLVRRLRRYGGTP